ncbi:agrin isoform X3 [Lepeophtheirus salmonis]|uniref:agrin isoform X3 n=1 Tax=Lepeophtheirus salmonis TaxID=72036 RepID=UPI003AF3E790
MRSIRFSDQVFSDESPSSSSSRRNPSNNIRNPEFSENYNLRECPPRGNSYSSLPRRRPHSSSVNNGGRGSVSRSYAIDSQDYFDEIDYRGNNYLNRSGSSADLPKIPRSTSNGGRESILKNGSSTNYKNSYDSVDRSRPPGILSSKHSTNSSSFNDDPLRRKRENFKSHGNSYNRTVSSTDKTDDEDYPAVGKPVSTVQIIATPHRPCCSKMRSPIAWTSFLALLILAIIAGVGTIFYYNGGLSWSLVKEYTESSSSSNAKQQHTRLQIAKSCDDENPCPFGGVCVHMEDSTIECQCKDTCPYAYTPVCGSDQVTYDNECKMKLAICRKKKRLKKVHSGICGVNSCLKLSCPDYSRCIPSYDGSSAKCVCPEPCKDSNNRSAIVCGSDGKDYSSDCHLQRIACQNRIPGLEVRYKGPCNPCSGFNCDVLRFQECHVLPIDQDKQERIPRCMCNTDCSDKTSPVCASNGQTYKNDCYMKLDSCRRLLDLHIVYPDTCSKGVNPCKLLNCDWGQECEISKQGITNCVCPQQCEPIIRPICGSDRITYENLCSLRKSACEKRKIISPIHYGICGSNGPCSKRKCNHNSICVESEDLAFCECPSCESLEYHPVCGTNGKMYSNSCQLSREACLKEDDSLTVGDIKSCSGCANVTCDFHGYCHKGECHCPSLCDNEIDHVGSVCGTDDITYPSECQLKITACRERKNIMVASVGKCDICRGINCQYGAKCLDGVCVCPTNCPRHEERLCGTDYMTYLNECEMLKATCTAKNEGKIPISFLHHGPCRSSTKMTECHCSELGSEKLDCDQYGKCSCKPGINGDACELCFNGELLTERGCNGLFMPRGIDLERCGDETCKNGAHCVKGSCTCREECPYQSFPGSICASDGRTYDTECQLVDHICKSQKHLYITRYNPCQEEKSVSQTPNVYTEPSISLIKPTRDIQDAGFNNQYQYPATPTSITVHGLLGDYCINDLDCSVHHGVCSETRQCICDTDYESSVNGRFCILSQEDQSPCSSNPCLGGGTCEEHDGTFTCFCPSNRMGNQCEMELSAHEPLVPLFNGLSSYVELAALEKVDHKLSMSIEFKSFDSNGLIFYAQQYDNGEGDFISLAIVKGYIEFRYNLGDGPVSIISSHPIKINNWHKVQAKRWHRDGILKMDSYPDVRGQTKGTLRSLDILTHPFIGGYPIKNINYLSINFGTSDFFSGCIREFKLGHKDIKIQSASEPKSRKRVDLGECQTAECKTSPCKNEGRCVEGLDGKYLCQCKKNYSGPECQEEKNACTRNPCKGGGECKLVKSEPICECPPGRKGTFCELVTLSDESAFTFVPSFNSKSYIELPTLRHVSKSFEIQVWFLTYQPNGMILYNGQNTNGHGDFLSLNLVNKKVQYRYDLGSGIANMTSKESVQIGQWHKVKITRKGPHGSLQLDDGQVVTGSSYAPLTELNLNLPLYLGGFKFSYTLSRNSDIVIGLDGAIQGLSVNGHLVEDLMEHAKDSRRITRFSGPPCDSHKCLNGGLCKPSFRSYTCKCRKNYIGKYCEKHLNVVDDKRPVHFNGKTYLKFMNKLTHMINTNETNMDLVEEDVQLIEWNEDFDTDDDEQIGQIIDDFDSDEETFDIYGRRGETNNKFTVHLRTIEKNGLLIWINQGTSLKGDFLAVAIVDGYPELSYKLGKKQNTLRIKSKKRINDDKWHRLKVIRRRRTGLIQVDKLKPIRGKSGTGASILNTNGKVWLETENQYGNPDNLMFWTEERE